MEKIKIDKEFISEFVDDKELDRILPKIKDIHSQLIKKTCLGNDFLGWLDLPNRISKKEIEDIEGAAYKIRKKSTAFVVIGIGGSYLGAKAGIEFLNPILKDDRKLKIYYAGNNLCGDYLKGLLENLKDEKIAINVVSKSGTTVEPAIAFRIIKDFLSKRYSAKELKDRIICTTDEKRGVLLNIAKKEGLKVFNIPDNIGGRFSVLTPAGLLPFAVMNMNLKELIKGARLAYNICNKLNYSKNPSYLYAGIRYLLSCKGKDIEILSSFHQNFHYLAEWWKQLFGESEGKGHKGIFPASCGFTTDLHSMGQLIQDGKRNIFETFLVLENNKSGLRIPKLKSNEDNLDYLSGRDIEDVNYNAFLATRTAHFDGGVPNITIFIPKRDEYNLGQLLYFFEKAVAISGLLKGVNPFNQPGVEAYKKNMFKLLGRK